MPELREKHLETSTDTVPTPRPNKSQQATKSPPLAARMPPPGASTLELPVGTPPVDESALILPNGKFVTTVTLNSRTCRWPVGDPTEAGFHYCGQRPISSGPYCEAHDRRGYQPVRSRASRPPKTH
jgi:GcrA cell cycle regulator